MATVIAEVSQFYAQIARGELRSSLNVDKIGFLNVGYWTAGADTLERAQIHLIETLVEFFSRTDGTILDVACGKGASTKFLTKYFDPAKITGINISQIQLQLCRATVPECTFRLMDATELDLPDESIDNVLCIEAAQHFMTRAKFLGEAFRVLTPGGKLAIHDIVLSNPDRSDAPRAELWPKENYMATLQSYKSQLLALGFKHVRIEDVTEFSVIALARCLIRKLEKDSDRMSQDEALEFNMSILEGRSPWAPQNCAFCLVYAIK